MASNDTQEMPREHANTQAAPGADQWEKMSVKKASRRIGVSTHALYRFIKERKLGYRMGRKVIVDLPELLNEMRIK